MSVRTLIAMASDAPPTGSDIAASPETPLVPETRLRVQKLVTSEESAVCVQRVADSIQTSAVSYTHLTLPTKRIV